MKKLWDRFDRFCYRHSNKGISNLMLFVAIGTAAVYMLSLIDPSNILYGFLYFSPALVRSGQVWRMISYIFIPNTNNLIFLAISLYFYYFIGSTLERQWGALRLNIFYFSGVLLTSLISLLLGSYANAVYVNLSLFLAFATLYPDTRVLLFFFIPVKMKYLAYVYLAFVAVTVISSPFPYSLIPLVALLNFILFFLPELLSRAGGLKNRYFGQGAAFRRQTKQSRANPGWADRYRSKDGKAPYRHKCSVCGKTDTEYPGLDFRYCSRCNGYYCYCPEHINSHVHIK